MARHKIQTYWLFAYAADGCLTDPPKSAHFWGDADAINWARNFVSGLPIELWQDDRLVATLQPGEASLEPPERWP